MRVLGIDTSTALGALGIIDGANTLFAEKMGVRPGGAERFPALIQRALQEIGWEPKDLDLIVVGKGPGSYTGVRVGITIAKGLSFSLGLPLVGVNTLYVLAANAGTRPGLICPLLESRKDQVYAALYFRREAALREILPPTAWSLPELCAYIKREQPGTAVLFIGAGAVLHEKTIGAQLGAWAVFGEEEENLVNGVAVAREGLVRWIETNVNELYSCLPLYLKPTEAEVRWEERRSRKFDPDQRDVSGRPGRGIID